MKRSKRPVVGNSNQILQPIKEDDFEEIKDLMREKSDLDLTKYVERLCLFRMSMVGYIPEDRVNTEMLFELIHKIGGDEIERIILPNEFEISRNIILRIREKKDFDRILEEI